MFHISSIVHLSLFLLLIYLVFVRAQVGLAETGILLAITSLVFQKQFFVNSKLVCFCSVTRPPSIYAHPEPEFVYKIGEALRLVCIATGVPTPR